MVLPEGWRRGPGPPEYRSLLDALLEDAEEHRAAGRLIQAANAFAAVENLRTIPPWRPADAALSGEDEDRLLGLDAELAADPGEAAWRERVTREQSEEGNW